MPAGRTQQRPIGLCRRHGRAAELKIERTTRSGFNTFNIPDTGENVANVANICNIGLISFNDLTERAKLGTLTTSLISRMFSQEGVHGVVAMPAPMAAHVVVRVDEKKMPDCSADVAKACLSTFIKRAIVDKSDSVDEVMEAWNGRLLGPLELASKILARWEAVRTYARTHDTLTVLSEVERPLGRILGKILSLKDSRESEEILHRIVGIPLEIVTQMRALYATPSPAGTASSRKRTRAEPSMPSIRAEDPCASDPGASLGCVARCGSCEPGCGCTEWDKTNRTELDGHVRCYFCYQQLCAQKNATPTQVQHFAGGKPIAISTVATGRLATREARGLCDTAMAAMRTLVKRRSNELHYAKLTTSRVTSTGF